MTVSSVVKIGTEILVNTATTGDQNSAQMARLANGGFVVTWVDWGNGPGGATGDLDASAIKAQVFASNGAKVGPELLANTASIGWQQDPKVVGLSNGNFVVTWTDGWDFFSYSDHNGSLGVGGAGGDDSGKAVKAQLYSARHTHRRRDPSRSSASTPAARRSAARSSCRASTSGDRRSRPWPMATWR